MSDARSTARTTLEQPAQPGDLQGAELAVPLKLTRLIGAGGMGEVWEARSADLPGMRFAIKVVSQAHANNKLIVARFFGEARAAAAIDDPNILIIHGTGRTADGRPALVMQYIEGSSLSELCEERGPLPIDAAGKILLQIASALHAAHRRNITHRDIKGQNVMVAPNRWGREWFVTLVDFGIAKFHDADLALEIRTRTRSYLGTPGYSAPEQILGQAVDAKADTYALGVLAYRCLCGRPPYLAENGNQVMNFQLNGAPFPAPRELRPDIPIAWNNVILASLARNPTMRPTAAEFARQIADGMRNGAALLAALAPRIATDAQGADGGAVTPSSAVPTARSQRASQTRRRARFSTVVALVVGASLGVAATGVAFTLHARQYAPAPEATAAPVATAVAGTLDAGVDGPRQTQPAATPPDVRAVTSTPDAGVDGPEQARPAAMPPDEQTARTKPPVAAAITTERPAVAPNRAMGAITLRAEPWADCFLVDGGRSVSLGTTPVSTMLSVGPHRVRLVNEARHRDETVTVTIDAARPSLVEKSW